MFDSKNFLANVSLGPGVYRMYNAVGDVIYVGKAGSLRKRLSSYFGKGHSSNKTRALVASISRVEVTLTNTEAEALLLENTLIKQFKPRYNVLLRDDKSYPYIYISSKDEYPRLSYHRGGKQLPGQYIGPYPHANAVKKSLRHVQKLFRVRQCADAYFYNRSRPCLQYQIKRCSGPCVGLITPSDYRRDLERTQLLLAGEDRQLIAQLGEEMERAAAELAFERAAQLRDQIADIQSLAEKQYVSGDRGDLDIVACALRAKHSCVQVFFIRKGVNLGNKAFYPATPDNAEPTEVLYAFLTQFYLQHEIPPEILLSHPLADRDVLQTVLSEQGKQRVHIVAGARGARARWVALAKDNAESALVAQLSSRAGSARRLEDLRRVLELDTPPGRMECFDISHTRGENTVASCVVFNAEGPLKASYRRFAISDITPGDDYAAMRQALSRRYTRALKENANLPDVLFVDGGIGQVGVAREVLAELQLDEIVLVGVAKGPERIAGEEVLVIAATGEQLTLGRDSPALHLVQQIRDEAHRFAITSHRNKRAKQRRQSTLEQIPGLGPKRRRSLLSHFGGMQGLQRAGVEDVAQAPGISHDLARRVYDQLHGEA